MADDEFVSSVVKRVMWTIATVVSIGMILYTGIIVLFVLWVQRIGQ